MLGHCFHTMLHSRILRAAVAIVALVAMASSRRAEAGPFTPKLVYDSISNLDDTVSSSLNASGSTAAAGKFSFPTITDGWQLDTVSLMLSVVPTGTVELQLWSDGGTVPGSQITAATFTNPQTWAPGVNTFRSNYYAPTQGQSYWLVLRGFSGAGNFATWNRTNGAVSGPGASRDAASFSSSFGGGQWSPLSTGEPMMMQIYAVPEPSTYAMGLAGLSVTAISALRRRRRKAALKARQQAAAL